MTTRSLVQLALVVCGLAVWGYGYRIDDPYLRWIGIGFFAAATLLRFLKHRERK